MPQITLHFTCKSRSCKNGTKVHAIICAFGALKTTNKLLVSDPIVCSQAVRERHATLACYFIELQLLFVNIVTVIAILTESRRLHVKTKLKSDFLCGAISTFTCNLMWSMCYVCCDQTFSFVWNIDYSWASLEVANSFK